ncbi:heat shock protein 70 family [Flagelloscypha sp. PMI_526]|nr:heat shock protein 70 family [Flagelloscypha sp. PMI_526]
MAVVGVDFGSLHSKIGVARHRGIDIITNEVSNRATPSLVAFGVKNRSIGESAKTQETSNFKNTVGSLKRLIGRTVSDPEIENYEKKYLNAKLVDVNGSVGVQVNYLGEQQSFSATQLVGAYLGKIRDIAAAELKTGVSDIVIAVPGWFTDVQRRAVIDAAGIAGLNVLRLINDSTATALGYGITKSDLPDPESPRHVAFVDVGHSSMTVSVVGFAKGQLTVKSNAFDRHIGGRDLDFALVQHFAAEFKEKYKIDVLSSPKATFRLASGCEKLKKILSANLEAPLNVESIMNDVDASSKLNREQFEALIQDVLDRIPAVLDRAIAESGLTLDQIDSVELVGGSTRIPAVRTRIQAAFGGKVLSTTLNSDEAVARGATFSCAMASPVFRVRDFSVHDIQNYPIKLQWQKTADDEDTELEVFSKGNGIPSTKILSFTRTEPFEVESIYVDPPSLPGGINPWISRYAAKSLPSEASSSKVRVKVRLNPNSVFSFDASYVEELVEQEEKMEVDGEGEAPKIKKKVVKHQVPFFTGHTGLESSVLEKLKEQEAQMHASDKLVADTEDRKNALEEYVYDTRSKLDDRYAAYVEAAEKEKLLAALQEAEDWLYTEEGEDATKSAYVTRLDALKVLGDPITFRWRENEERPRAIAQLRETLNAYMNQATSGEEKYSHIDEKDKQSVVEKVATVQKWLEDMVVKQSERPKKTEPVLKVEEIGKKRDEVIYFATPILSKPKPKPPVIPGGSGTQTPQSGTSTPQPPPPAKEDAGPSEMDVD